MKRVGKSKNQSRNEKTAYTSTESKMILAIAEAIVFRRKVSWIPEVTK